VTQLLLAYLIATFNSMSFQPIYVTNSGKDASTKYIKDNNGIDTFMTETFDYRTNRDEEFVFLFDAFKMSKKLKYHDVSCVERRHHSSPKLKMESIKTHIDYLTRRTFFTHRKATMEIQEHIAPEPTRGYPTCYHAPALALAPAHALSITEDNLNQKNVRQ
jgi:hypothetical protein